MRIMVWGLGYVGTVTAACLAELGHEVVGVERNDVKVRALNSGVSPVREPGLDDLVRRLVAERRLQAVKEGHQLVPNADILLICVGTPSAFDGSAKLDHVQDVAQEIGRGLRNSNSYQVVVLRSTVFPGTCRNFLSPLLEQHSGRVAGRDFGIVANPEFLRETSAISDFYTSSYIVVGQLDRRSGDLVEGIYKRISAPVRRVSLEEAELLKLMSNAFHSLKIGFANEIGRLCERIGLDAQIVMRLLCEDTKLNISSAYLEPGFAFGGSCLPKDLRLLTVNARRLGLEVPILESIIPSNNIQVERARSKLFEIGASRIAILGLSFKPGTDDLRESPVISLIRTLSGDGVQLKVYDPEVNPDALTGSNREFLEEQLPEFREMLCSRLEDALRGSNAVVVTQRRAEFTSALYGLDHGTAVLDLVRLNENPLSLDISNYYGICW